MKKNIESVSLPKNKLEVVDNNKKENNFAIEIKDFTKRFSKFTAVNKIDMKVSSGKIHGFIGPNGSGKTTTIKSLIGAIVPTEGKLLIKGMKSSSIEAHSVIGYIPENARFPKHLNLLKYLTEMGFLRGMTYKKAKIKAKKIIESLQYDKFKYKNPNSFSSGMKKKVLLAQALINNPEILILDEPAANLDPSARISLFNDLKKLRSQGKTILICSHILSELQEIADEITILNYGNIAFSGSIIVENEKYYTVTTLEKEMYQPLIKIINQLNYKIYQKKPENNTLILHLPNESDDIKRIVRETYSKNIILILIQPFVSNISEIYNNYVYKANKNIEKVTAIV